MSGRSSSTSGIENQADSAAEPQVAARQQHDAAADRQPVGDADRDLREALEHLAGAPAEVGPGAPVEVVDRWLRAAIAELGARPRRPVRHR